jgi:imidazolonepropionase-like amidohydrolase
MILIKNADLYTMDEGGRVSRGDVLMDGAKIAAVGQNLSAPGAKVFDARGRAVMPGIVDAHCHIGMWEDGMGFEGADGNEIVEPVSPALRALDAVNPVDPCFREAVEGGVTTACTGPGSANVIGGQFLAMKTAGRTMAEMVVREPQSLKSAFGENPKRCYSGLKKSPSTRMATAAIFREAFLKARAYMDKSCNPDPDKRPAQDLGLDVLVSALRGEIPVKMHAHRADDILTAIRLANEFGLKATIDHCTEGHLILDELKKADIVGCILGPIFGERSKIELRNKTFRAPYEFYKAGVPFALMTDHPVIPIQHLRVQAGICVAEGLPEYEAMKAITRNAARMIGLADRLGSLAAGKDADVVMYEGDPLDCRSNVALTVINGDVVFER